MSAATLLSSLVRYTNPHNARADLFPFWIGRAVPSEPGHPVLLTSFHQSPDSLAIYHHGCGMIRGTLTIQGVPARAKVGALEACSPFGVRGTWSDETTGKFTIYPLVANRRYIIIGTDPRARFNADVAGYIAPVAWEDDE